MLRFIPCKDRNACTEDGLICKGCGRSHEEIACTRAIVAELVSFVSTMQYENPEDFLAYITRKVTKKIKLAQDLNS